MDAHRIDDDDMYTSARTYMHVLMCHYCTVPAAAAAAADADDAMLIMHIYATR